MAATDSATLFFLKVNEEFAYGVGTHGVAVRGVVRGVAKEGARRKLIFLKPRLSAIGPPSRISHTAS